MAGKWLRASGGNWLRGDGTSIWLRNPPPLYLRSTQTNGITSGGVNCYDLSTTQGSTPDTAVVTATNSGTDIQWTKTAGGSVLVFATGRVPAGGWTFANAELALWAKQSIAAVNAGLRVRFYKWASGTETLIGGSPHDDGAELSTYSQEMVWTGDATDTALAEDERLLVKYYLTNVGTMAAGEAVIRFNGGTTNEAKLIVKHEFCSSFVNLTSYGAEDGHSYDAAGNVIRKTGGGSLITVTGYDYDLDITSAYNGFGGVFLARQVTTTDFTASNITNKSDCAFLSFPNTVRKGVRITAPAGLDERTLTILLPHTMAAGQTEAINLIVSVSGTGAPESVTLNPAPTPGVDTDATVTIRYAAGQAGQTLTVDFYPNASATAGTRYIGYRGAHLTAVAAAPSINESRLQLYPEVDFKAEGGGATVVDLTAASLGFTKQNPQLKVNNNLTAASLLYSAKAVQLKNNVVQAAASLLYSAKTVQLKVNNNLTAAALNFSANAVQLKNNVVQAAASLLFSAKTVQLKVNNNLTAAALNFSAQIVNAFNSGGAIVVDLATAAFGFVSHTVQAKVTAPLSLAALSLTAQAVQLRATAALTLASLLTSAKTIQLRATVALTAAQNSLTAQLIGARLTLSVTVANTLRFISNGVQTRQIVSLIKANFYFLPLAVNLVGQGVAAVVVRFRYSMTRFRQLLRGRKY